MPLIQVEDIVFNCSLSGQEDSPQMVFISGYTCDINFWLPVANALQETHRILLFDNQGINKTTDNNSPLTIEVMAENISKLLKKLEFRQAIIVGFAMGSSIALRLAYDYPLLAKKLILLSPAITWSTQSFQIIEQLIELRQKKDLNGYFSLLYDTAFGSDFKASISKNNFIEDAQAAPFTQTLNDQLRQANALKSFDSSTWLNKLDVECVILSPIEDQFAFPKDSKELASHVRGKYISIPCGHAALAEKPEAIIELCKQYSKFNSIF